MILRYLLLFGILFFAGFSIGQKAENIIKSERPTDSYKTRACLNDAGSIQMGNFIGQSTRQELNDTVFLCWKDRFYIDHNGDFDLSSDPDPSTFPGIGYAWYDGIPTISGTDLTSIEADPQAYKPSGELVVYVDKLNGNALFENDYYTGFTSFNDYISGGNVTQKYFAPITFDKRVGSQAKYEGSPAGACANVSVDEAFTVVYLNEIKAGNIATHVGGDAYRVQFVISGGMPEFDGSDYSSVVVQLKNKTSVKGSFVQSSFTHGSLVEFTVPEFGVYEIIMQDDISCTTFKEVNIQENLIPTFVLDTLSGEAGNIVCLTWSVRDFQDIQYIFGGMKFDPSVVKFSSYNPLDFHDVVLGSIIGPDQISVQWVAINDQEYDQPDGEQFAEICFEIIGEPGDCTPIYFNNTDAVFTDSIGGGDVHPNQEMGMICVDPPAGLYVRVDVCGSVSGLNEGTVSFEVFGGTGPYSFALKDAGGTTIRSGTVVEGQGKLTLFDIGPAFNYTLTVIDALGASWDEDVDVLTIDEPLTITFDYIKNPTCYGYADGEISIDVSGSVIFGPGDYYISWSTLDYGVDTLIRLSNGTYGVTVTEKVTGCETEEFVTLDVPPLELELNILDTAYCAESGGGRIQAVVGGGTTELTGYNYIWSSGASSLSDQGYSSTFVDLSPGMAYIEVYDSFRYCKIIDSIEMPFLYELELGESMQDPFCFNENNGSLQLNASLGNYPNGNFSFVPLFPYTPATENFTPIGSDSLFADSLGEGFYRIEVTELNTGCKTVADFFFINPTRVQSSIITDDLGCQEGQFGSATLMVRGGNDPYIISSNSGLPDANISFSTGTHLYDNLNEGIYYITIVDSVGCTIQDTFEIKGTNEQLSIDSLVYEPFDCVANATTDITAYASSSGIGIFYLWKNNLGQVIDIDNVLNNAGAGKYYIEVSDNNGCEAIDSVELFEPNLFTLNLVVTEPECTGGKGGTLGSICANVLGGTPGYSYTWQDGTPPDASCLDNLAEGSYSLVVTDVNNCKVDTTIDLSGPTPIDVDIISVDGISCNDGSTFDGQITLTASGGNNPTVNYSYELSSGTGGFGQFYSTNDLEGGQNWVLVSFNTLSGNTCYADTAYFDIDVPEALEMDYNALFIQNVSCYGECDGVAIVGATGGNDLLYQYNWQETGSIGAAVSGLCAGTYHVEISDANGCKVVDSIAISQPDSLFAYEDPVNTHGVNCFGENSGQIQILHEGGNIAGAFSYNWLNAVSDGPLAKDLAPGFYSVTVTDEKGCSDVVDITLDAQEPIIAEIPIPDPINCFGEQTCITVNSAQGGAGPDYRFSINGGPLYSLDSCVNVYASEQAYLVEVFDREGCSFSGSLLIDQPAEIVVYLGDDIEVGLGEQAILNAQVSADNPIQVIEWTPMGATDQCMGLNCQQLEIHPNSDLTYTVRVMDVNGCLGSDEINVTVSTRRNVYIPNVFSPNGDAHNERFKVYAGTGVRKINFIKVYNRWGELMYNETNLEPDITGVGGWDGTYKSKKLNPGVFVYLVEVDFIDERKITYRGSLTLLK